MKMNFPQNQIIPLENRIVDRSVSVVIERDSKTENNNETPKFELSLLEMKVAFHFAEFCFLHFED